MADGDDDGPADGPAVLEYVKLARKPGTSYTDMFVYQQLIGLCHPQLMDILDIYQP